MRAAWPVIASAVSLAGFLACSSSEGSSNTIDTGGGGSGGTSHPTGGSGGSGGASQLDSGSGTGGGPARTDAACTNEPHSAQVTPVNLIFLYDKSGSMGVGASWDNMATRWTPMKEALIAFLSDPVSTGLQASLKFLPANGDETAACTAANYLVPDVPLQPLTADNPAFVTALENTTPAGGTPTMPALQGTIEYARSVWDQHRDQVPVVVLVTDGEPGLNWAPSGQTPTMRETCMEIGATTSPNTIAEVANVARLGYEGTPQIRTYVIGIGPSLTNLNQIAESGGTGQATIVSDTDPTVTREVFAAALEAIREQAISCNLQVPTPPPGEPPVDLSLVNVDLTTSSGTVEYLDYDRNCQNGTGWMWDNETTRSWIVLCPDRCTAARSDLGAQIVIQTGCETRSLY